MQMLLGTLWYHQVLLIWNVSHTLLVKVMHHHADQHVLMDNHGPNIMLKALPVSHQHKDKMKCLPMDQLQHVSMCTKIS